MAATTRDAARSRFAAGLTVLWLAAAATLALAVATGTAAAQTLEPPTFETTPEYYANDATPTWTFTGDPEASFNCTLLQWFDGASSGDPLPPNLIDRRECDSGRYTFDLSSYRDAGYALEVTQTDASGIISGPASNSFYLDRFANPPLFRTVPDNLTNDPTPIWEFIYYEQAPTFHCTLTREGATDPVYDGGCDRQTFTFDLNSFPDDTYTLSVTLTDLAGNTSDPVIDSFVLDRTTPNAAPVASMLSRCDYGDYRMCSFNASASSDRDGQIVSYRFDFGDGQFLIQDGRWPEAWHTYNGPGVYTVTVTVTDNADATATASQDVRIGTPSPSPTPTPSPTACVGTNGTDVQIPDLATVESLISIAGCQRNASSKATIEVHIVHTWIGDLVVTLIAPDGSTYLLHKRAGGGTDNIDRTYTVNLSSEPAGGTWRLRVRDAAAADVGRIDSWAISL